MVQRCPPWAYVRVGAGAWIPWNVVVQVVLRAMMKLREVLWRFGGYKIVSSGCFSGKRQKEVPLGAESQTLNSLQFSKEANLFYTCSFYLGGILQPLHESSFRNLECSLNPLSYKNWLFTSVPQQTPRHVSPQEFLKGSDHYPSRLVQCLIKVMIIIHIGGRKRRWIEKRRREDPKKGIEVIIQ